MSTSRTDRGPVLAAALVAALLLAGCSDDSRSAQPMPERGHGQQRDPEPRGAREPSDRGRSVAEALTAVLEQRAAALREGDREAFEAGLQPRDGGFAAGQVAYFDNLGQLPLRTLRLELQPETLVRDGRGYWADVAVTMRLRGYDARPVVTRDHYRFVRAGGRYRVASVAGAGPAVAGAAQPWDLGPVEVVTGDRVLGVFDAASTGRAGEVVAAVERGAAAVADRVPLDWDRRVVVYALGSPDFLAGLDGVPGGDPLAVDAVAVPVMAAPGSGRVADTRIVLNPRLLDETGPARDRLLRHELTHVAVGSLDDRLPVWLSEGIAEHVSVQPIPPARRVISGTALDAARRGLSELPDDEGFNGPDSAAHYGVAWWACEAVVATYGESMLWSLAEQLAGSDDPDAELRAVLGLTEAQLAEKAGRLMLATYEPAPERDRRSTSGARDRRRSRAP